MREEERELRVDLLWCISPSEVRPSDTDCMMYMNTCQESTSSITSHLVSTCHNWSVLATTGHIPTQHTSGSS